MRTRRAVAAPSLDLEPRVKTRERGDGIETGLCEWLQRIEAKQDRILAALEQRARPRDADDTRVLLAMVGCAVVGRFSAAEVLRHAALHPDLRAALEAADCDSPRSLGRLFRRRGSHRAGPATRTCR